MAGAPVISGLNLVDIIGSIGRKICVREKPIGPLRLHHLVKLEHSARGIDAGIGSSCEAAREGRYYPGAVLAAAAW